MAMKADATLSQYNTVLAALRFYQKASDLPTDIEEMAQPDGGPVALDDDEIDELCEGLNFSDITLASASQVEHNTIMAALELLKREIPHGLPQQIEEIAADTGTMLSEREVGELISGLTEGRSFSD
ncbi:hypothetical protein [Halomonas sp. I5-271120]|uniref:hypothetical protein n=1 Tax=Halomonas sp. I5-271120 TaxID=3061632 RepID=UPI0027154739|nr:hypothetical protein [Halomonas sp. I5-271120]